MVLVEMVVEIMVVLEVLVVLVEQEDFFIIQVEEI